MIGTNLTGGIIPGATRIDSACFTDGNDDELIIEFWQFSGSILRTCYDRRTTQSREEFIPIADEAYARLERMAAPSFDI